MAAKTNGTQINYTPTESAKVLLATMRLVRVRRFKDILGPIGSCICCYKRECKRSLRLLDLLKRI